MSAKRKIWIRDSGICTYCGRPVALSEMHVDHIVPRSKGGSGKNDNFTTSCETCNKAKSNMSVQDFDLYIDCLPEKLMSDPVFKKANHFYHITFTRKTQFNITRR
jgi:hypothetical protein